MFETTNELRVHGDPCLFGPASVLSPCWSIRRKSEDPGRTWNQDEDKGIMRRKRRMLQARIRMVINGY